MLQRAASNDYSWWWANHIKTKQGKWLQQSLDDMEEKVKSILQVIEEDANSFGKRAEMYYEKRPELINFVEESYRAYRALADRYEHISGDMQNANNTIAKLFPDQVQLAMEENDNDNTPKTSRINRGKAPKAPENPKFKIPPIQEMKRSLPPKQEKSQVKRTTPQTSEDEAHEEIDKLQKEILVLHTKKEFVKSSYEIGLAKYWDIGKQIEEMQEIICSLQNESGAATVIDDNDARALMTSSVLKSCEDTLLQLQEQQKRSTKEARVESERVKDAKEKLHAFKERYLQQHKDKQEIPYEAKSTESSSKNLEKVDSNLMQDGLEVQLICEKVKEYFEINSNSSLTVVELAEVIDEIVTKVLSLETSVTSQTALIKRLRSETDELQKHLQSLEEDEKSLIDDSKNLSDKVRELEEELHGIQDLNQSVEDQNNMVQTDFTETCRNLDKLSEKLQVPKKEEIDIISMPHVEEGIVINVKPHKESQEQENMWTFEDSTNSKDEAVEHEGKIQGIRDLDLRKSTDQENHFQPDPSVLSENLQDPQQDEAKDKNSPHAEDSILNVKPQKKNEEQTDSANWQNLYFNGLVDREKILLTEYISTLQNYRETKRELSEMEKKNQESLFDVMAQIEELKSVNTKKDLEIQSLKQKLSIVQTSPGDNLNCNLKKSRDLQHIRTTIDQWKYFLTEIQKKRLSRPKPRSLEDLLKERNTNFALRSKELSALASTKNLLTEDNIVLVLNEEPHALSTVEEKFRRDIDRLLEENIEFWLRFSTTSPQIQKFETKIQDVHEELSKQKKNNKKHEVGTSTADPTEKSLRELQGELSVWLEQNASLKNELQCRLSSLCKIQEEILRVSKVHSETEQEKFTSQQAAKYQGEVMDMKQENNKVADELQAGLDHVRGLQLEVEKALSKLSDNSEMSVSKGHRRHHRRQQQHVRHSASRSRVPLRSFLFGSKPKKAPIFSAFQKQHDMQAEMDGLPM